MHLFSWAQQFHLHWLFPGTSCEMSLFHCYLVDDVDLQVEELTTLLFIILAINLSMVWLNIGSLMA